MLRLRPYKPQDAEYIAKWIIDERQYFQWSADRMNDYPLTAEKLNAHYEEYGKSDSFWTMTAIDEAGVPRGQLIMRFLDEEKNDLRFGFIIVDCAVRGKGYGKEMLRLAIRYAFDVLQVKRVSLGVFANNPKAAYCYEAAGLKEKGENSRYNCKVTLSTGEEIWECIELELLKA